MPQIYRLRILFTVLIALLLDLSPVPALATGIAPQLSAPARLSIAQLKVTGDEFVTQGNMGKLFETEQRIATKDALGMSYRAGGEDELSGVYVKLGWGQRCVLPRVSEEQSRVTIDAITAKFPEIATDDSAFSIFGQGDQLITLGLSGSGKKD